LIDMTRAGLVVLFVVLDAVLHAAPAAAGICEGEQTGDIGMTWVERFAVDKNAPIGPETEGAPWLCARAFAVREAKRVEVACEKILDRDGDQSECVDLAAAAGFTRIGKHDIFAVIAARPLHPYDTASGFDDTLGYLAAMHDPRAVPIVVKVWRDTLPIVDKWTRSRNYFIEWSSWRQAVAALLGELGGADERSFLLEQAAATVDTHVADACRAGAAAIAKRLDARGRAAP